MSGPTVEAVPGSSFVYAATRTPFGRFGSALAERRADEFAGAALDRLVQSRQRRGVAAIRIGVGQALAVVVENVREVL